MNIRGLLPQTVPSKVPYIKDLLDQSSPAAFALTETWLNESHLDAETHIEGYVLLRSDRIRKKATHGRSSGGVAVFVREDYALTAETIFSYSNGVIESLGVHITELNLVFIVTYRSPDSARHSSTAKEFATFLVELKKTLRALPTPTPDVILTGDYNLPHADWFTGECSPGACKDEQNMVRSLYDVTLEYFLTQQIDQPTHKNGNVIDLLFTNNSYLIHNLCVIPSSKSDHYRIDLTARYKSASEYSKEDTQHHTEDDEATGFNRLNFFDETIDWKSLDEELNNYNWSSEFRGMDAAGMMERFTTVCLSIAEKWVPPRRHPRHSTTKPQKVPRHRRILMRNRTKLNKRFLAAKSEANRQSILQKLINIEKELSKSHENKRELEEKRAIEKIKINPKFFFAFGRRFSKIKIGVGPLIDSAKKLVSAPLEMAEILSNQYSSVFSTPQHMDISPHILFPDVDDAPQDICDIIFSDWELANAMQELSSNAAPGPDGFPAILLKRCSEALSPPLATIWRKSVSTGEIPEVCKSATIAPIHKGKSRAVPKNYRPVALTSHLIKVFEKVVRKNIVQFMKDNNLFNNSQHGFLGGRSCLSQLLIHFDRITYELEHGKGVDVIYLDFAKAFDKVDHGITLNKLASTGIKGKLGRWLYAFLTNRTQSVLVEGRKSQPKPVISGVPQGSVLGPLLFLVLIGDIDSNVASSFLSSFADDTRVGKGITSEADMGLLQSDLNSIYKWSAENNMMFNSEKFELVRYKSKDTKTLQSTTSYTNDDGSTITEQDHVRDLGIIMSNDATFTKHIEDKCSAMKSKVAWILRTFKSRAQLPMLTLWKTQVLCHLDYCSQLWSPNRTGSIQALELLQKSFFNKINGMYNLTYWDQLFELRSYSLERRRERYRIIYTWRIIEEQTPNFDCTPVISYRNPRRGRLCKIPSISSAAPSSIQNIRFSAFPVKGPRLFNMLPQGLRNMTGCTTDKFKGELDKYLSKIPDEPLIPGLTKYRRIETNSLIDWINSPHLNAQDTQCQLTRTPGAAPCGHPVTAV